MAPPRPRAPAAAAGNQPGSKQLGGKQPVPEAAEATRAAQTAAAGNQPGSKQLGGKQPVREQPVTEVFGPEYKVGAFVRMFGDFGDYGELYVNGEIVSKRGSAGDPATSESGCYDWFRVKCDPPAPYSYHNVIAARFEPQAYRFEPPAFNSL
jgi:hypothetical protein